MKTFAKTLLAGGLGLFGMFGAAQAALPYGYGSYGNGYGIAAGGCDTPAANDRCDGYGGYGGYRSAYDRDRYAPLPSRSTGFNDRYVRWDDDRRYGTTPRLPSRPVSTYDRCDDGYGDRYGVSHLFEPWRPATAKHGYDRRNW
jgi:hypothetical protein